MLWVLIIIALCLFLGLCGVCSSPVFEPVAAAGNGEYLGMVQESVQDRCGRGNIAEQLAPVFQRPVRGHYRGFRLVPPHDDFKEVFARTLGPLFDAHIVDDQEIRLEILGHDVVLVGKCLVVQEVSYTIKDRTISNHKAALDGLIANRLDQMTFSRTRRS